MVREFNTAGPCRPEKHYMIPPLRRLFVGWPYPASGGGRAEQREAVELKVWRPRERDPLEEGLAQLDG